MSLARRTGVLPPEPEFKDQNRILPNLRSKPKGKTLKNGLRKKPL